MDGLKFEQEYYKAQASLFLGGVLSGLKFLNEPGKFFCFGSLSSKQKRDSGFKRSELQSRKANSNMADNIVTLSWNRLQGIPKQDLAGLQAQISSINCLEFKDILSEEEESFKQNFLFSGVPSG